MYWERNVAYSFRLTLLFIGKRRHFLGQFIKVCPRCIVGLGDSWCVRLHIPPRFLQRSVTHGCVQFNNYASFHRIPMPMTINKKFLSDTVLNPVLAISEKNCSFMKPDFLIFFFKDKLLLWRLNRLFRKLVKLLNIKNYNTL